MLSISDPAPLAPVPTSRNLIVPTLSTPSTPLHLLRLTSIHPRPNCSKWRDGPSTRASAGRIRDEALVDKGRGELSELPRCGDVHEDYEDTAQQAMHQYEASCGTGSDGDGGIYVPAVPVPSGAATDPDADAGLRHGDSLSEMANGTDSAD